MAEVSHLNLARKYRPMTFDDLVGQGPISQTLSNSLKLGRIAHAYLFHGPRGCGKTTSARILAKALNCTGNGATGPVVNPCGKCPQCLEIAAGSDMDVLEIDAASNTQVEKVREIIIDTVALSAGRDRYKVFILDEVHMLSDSSFNALLKTIEEPPPHVVFIMATTEYHKVPATITSRCQGFRFKAINHADMLARLKEISANEKFDIEDAALEVIVKASGGALRDAQTLLDRAVSYATGRISGGMVSEMLGYMPSELVKMACGALIKGDGAQLHRAVETVRAEGYDPMAFLRDIKGAMAELFYFKLSYGRAPFDGADDMVRDVTPVFLAGFVRRMGKVSDEVRFSDTPLIQAEAGLFTLMQAVPDVEGFIRRLESLEGKISSGNFKSASAHGTVAIAANGRAEALSPVSAVAIPAAPQGFTPVADELEKTDRRLADGVVWKNLLDRLSKKHPLLHEIMVKCRVTFTPEIWTFCFSSKFQAETAERSAAVISDILKSITGRDIRIKTSVSAAEQKEHIEELVSERDAPAEPVTDEKPFAEGEYHWEEITAGGAPSAEDESLKKLLKIIPGRVVRIEQGGEK